MHLQQLHRAKHPTSCEDFFSPCRNFVYTFSQGDYHILVLQDQVYPLVLNSFWQNLSRVSGKAMYLEAVGHPQTGAVNSYLLSCHRA